MRKILTVLMSLCAGLVLAGGLAVAEPEIQIAASDDCQKRCQAAENQCRMASKDLNSSQCSAKFLACVQSCRR